jgi:carboxymethylenebutenolidase
MEIVSQATAPKGLVLVIHSWWGLTRSFRDYADRLADAGFAVGLSDLFDGHIAFDEKEARKLRRAPRKVPMHRTLIADIDALRGRYGSAFASVGVVGFSMGGHWAIWLSQQKDLPINATILYYAARAGNFEASRSSYLAHFADHDPWVKPETRRRMEKAIASADQPYAAFDYAGTRHWFSETDRAEDYDPAAADLALRRTAQHLSEHAR